MTYVAPSTRQTYQSGLKPFVNFCARFKISPLPTSSLTYDTLCWYVKNILYKTLKVSRWFLSTWYVYWAWPTWYHRQKLIIANPLQNLPTIRKQFRIMATHCHQFSMCNKELIVSLSIFTHRVANFVGIVTPTFYAFLCISEHTSCTP